MLSVSLIQNVSLLQRIASSHVHVGEQPLASGGIPKAAFVKGAAGRQLEIRARFRVGASALVAQRKFGLAVLASPGPNFFILSQMALDGRARAVRDTTESP